MFSEQLPKLLLSAAGVADRDFCLKTSESLTDLAIVLVTQSSFIFCRDGVEIQDGNVSIK